MSLIEGLFELNGNSVPEILREYSKTASIFDVLSLGLPTQEGLVVIKWNSNIAEFITSFMEKNQWENVLIRTDKKGETGRYMKGGYLISAKHVSSETQRILEMGRIVLLLKPSNKYENLYSINIQFENENTPVLLEIAGPGFDVSDINRGHISPHERIWLAIRKLQITHRIVDRKIIDHSTYLDTVNIRLRNIGKSFVSNDQINDKDCPAHILEDRGNQYLRSSGNTLLLKAAEKYTPLPFSYLTRLTSYIRDLPWQLPHLATESVYVISSSIIPCQGNETFIFWDIVYPSRKYVLRKSHHEIPLL